MSTYRVYHYDDELGGQFPEPMLALETDDLREAQAGCATLDTDRERLQAGGHTGIVALLDALAAAKAAGPEGQDWVDVAYGAGTVRVTVAPATLQMA